MKVYNFILKVIFLLAALFGVWFFVAITECESFAMGVSYIAVSFVCFVFASMVYNKIKW